jgi:hypothetical protein
MDVNLRNVIAGVGMWSPEKIQLCVDFKFIVKS